MVPTLVKRAADRGHQRHMRQQRVGEQLLPPVGVRVGELPPRVLEVVASYMIAVVDGLQIQALLDPDSVPTGEELAAFYEGLAASARATGASGADPESAVDEP